MPQVVFLSLDTFSRVGGIQQFNRLFSLALQRNARQFGWQIHHVSLWDKDTDPNYLDPQHFTGCNRHRFTFLQVLIRHVPKADVVVLGHINLAPVGLLLNRLFRRTRFVTMAHGVEVWNDLSRLQRIWLSKTDAIWAVSRYTADTIIRRHGVDGSRVQILYNTLDPAFAGAPVHSLETLEKRWRLGRRYPLLLTVARLRQTEEAKGYDRVLELIPDLAKDYPNLCYVLAGPWDELEYQRILQKIEALGIAGLVAMPGTVDRDMLPALYRHCQVFVMPSTKEGFGIVYLEAAFCGARVVATRAGGTPEALMNGQLGALVAPGDSVGLLAAVREAINHPLGSNEQAAQKKLVEEQFGFDNFTRRQAGLLQAYL